ALLFAGGMAQKLLTQEKNSPTTLSKKPDIPPKGDESDKNSNFRSVYLNPTLREEFFHFLENVYHLYPEKEFHKLILDLCTAKKTDKEIYEAILLKLPEIRPFMGII